MPRFEANRIITRSGYFGLYLFAFSMWLSPPGGYLGLGLMMLAALAHRDVRDRLRRDGMAKLALLFAVYLALYASWVVWITSPNYTLLWGDLWEWLRVFVLFIFVAWWLAGDERRIVMVLILSLAGLLVKMFMGEPGGLSILMSDTRSGFGLPIISFGLYSATALLGMLVLLPRVWRGRTWPGYVTAILFIMWCAAFVILLQGLIISRSRDAWIATLLIFPLILTLQLRGGLRAALRPAWWRAGAIALVVLSLLGGVATYKWDTIKARVQYEQNSWQALFAGEFDKIPDGSMGYRLQLVEFGLSKWLERPLVGWGPHSYRELIAQASNEGLRDMPHLHNAYVETLLSFGILGALFFVMLKGMLYTTIYQSWRGGHASTDIALFLAGALGLLMIWCLASFGLNQVAWNFYFALLAGAIYSYRFKPVQGMREEIMTS